MIYEFGFHVYRPTERERTERLIKTRLREIMMQKDLENVTSKEVQTSQTFHGLIPPLKPYFEDLRSASKIGNILHDNCPLQIRTELEMQMVCNLREFKEFIDNEMIVILGQMDSPTEIFDHLFLVGLPTYCQ